MGNSLFSMSSANSIYFFYGISVEVTDESKDKVLTCQWSIFVVGAGGFGGKRTSNHIVPTVDTPKRPADASLEYKTSIDQVMLLDNSCFCELLYLLNQD